MYQRSAFVRRLIKEKILLLLYYYYFFFARGRNDPSGSKKLNYCVKGSRPHRADQKCL